MDGPLISADSHVMEPLDLWTTRLPAALRPQGPRLEVRDGDTCLMVESTVVRNFSTLSRAEAKAGGGSPDGERAADGEGAADGERAKGFSSGGADAAARLRDLDVDGVWGEVIYPNLAFFCCHRIESAELQAAVARVYNDWAEEVFLGASERLAPVAILPVLDVEAAVAELGRVAARGFRCVLLPAHVDARPYNDASYDTLWAAAGEASLPLSFHAGTGRTQTPAHGPGGAVVNYVVTVSGPMETVAYLCGAGVLARHPDLRVVMVECGSGWLAWALHAMDDAYREHYRWVRPKLELLPSEYFRRQGFVTFQHDPVGLANLAFTGDHCLLWGSDYPHPEGTWPHSREVLARQMQGQPRATVERIVCRNAAALYGFAVPA
jgi:predicted TIM-barrel fold metal-dependent hydrolase